MWFLADHENSTHGTVRGKCVVQCLQYIPQYMCPYNYFCGYAISFQWIHVVFLPVYVRQDVFADTGLKSWPGKIDRFQNSTNSQSLCLRIIPLVGYQIRRFSLIMYHRSYICIYMVTRYSPHSLEACVKYAQRTHDAINTSLWRQNDVAVSFWRHSDVIINTVCVPPNRYLTVNIFINTLRVSYCIEC